MDESESMLGCPSLPDTCICRTCSRLGSSRSLPHDLAIRHRRQLPTRLVLSTKSSWCDRDLVRLAYWFRMRGRSHTARNLSLLLVRVRSQSVPSQQHRDDTDLELCRVRNRAQEQLYSKHRQEIGLAQGAHGDVRPTTKHRPFDPGHRLRRILWHGLRLPNASTTREPKPGQIRCRSNLGDVHGPQQW